jgi:hypothetical protein
MTFGDPLEDLYWLYRRERVPAFVESLTGKSPQGFIPELGRYRITGRKESLLYLIVRALRPERVVETGVQFGWSSLAILAAMRENGQGKLHSIDLPFVGEGHLTSDGKFDPTFVGEISDTGRCVPQYLRDRWDLRVVADPAASTATLRQFAAEGPLDMFFHDSEHSYANMSLEYGIAWPALRTGGVLYSDDVDQNPSFQELARSVGRPERLFRIHFGQAPSVGGIRK